MATQRLWVTDPRRSTCLATVAATRGAAFALDRTLLAPASRAHRHPQPADRGTLWWEGEKRWVERVFERDGELWHVVPGFVPPVGAQVNLHLDGERRLPASRAHTAMHLVLAALARLDAPPVAADPEVRGGGTFRIPFREPPAPATLAAAIQQVRAWVAADLPVQRDFWTQPMRARLTPQRFHPPDPTPGADEVYPVVLVDGACAYPCDGTHVARTGQVGGVQVARHGASVQFAVAKA